MGSFRKISVVSIARNSKKAFAESPIEEALTAKNAHVIVCGNEKGGSGKTTTSFHLAIALLKDGHRVATVDLDSRQKSLTRYVNNRRAWAERKGVNLELPNHTGFEAAVRDSNLDAQAEDFSAFLDVISQLQHAHDFIVIDTPGHDGYLMRLAHSMADTLLTPLNDSFVDFDVLAQVDPQSGNIAGVSHYALMVREARRQRRIADDGFLDWIVVRNRLSSIASRNQKNLLSCVNDLSYRLGFRIAQGISERVVYREFFPAGLTALDDLGLMQAPGMRADELTHSHLAAREEIEQLIRALRLPVDKSGQDRVQARQIWFHRAQQPLATPDIFAD